MNNRLELQAKLEELLGNKHVYYQPPESLKMEYPAIRYSRDDIDCKNADNIKYIKNNRYEIIVIDKRADNEVIEKILDLPRSTFDRHYISNNLHHDILTIYF